MGVEYNQRELKRIRFFKREEPIVRHLQRVGDEIAATAKALAPRRTGLGAASIHAEVVRQPNGDLGVHIGWGEEFFYLRFHEFGTRGGQKNGRGVRARPFLRPAAQKYLA